jgi:hypothetical protein
VPLVTGPDCHQPVSDAAPACLRRGRANPAAARPAIAGWVMVAVGAVYLPIAAL